MTFELDLDPTDIADGREIGGSWMEVTYKFGFDAETCQIYFMRVGFHRLPSGPWELFFQVVIRHTNSGQVDVFWGGAVKPFGASSEERIIIRGSVNLAARLLLELKMPETVDMVTRDANLPAPALDKFGLLGDVFREYGYREVFQEPFHGKKVWRFTTDPDDEEKEVADGQQE